MPLTLPGFTVDLREESPNLRSPSGAAAMRADGLAAQEIAGLIALDQERGSPDWVVERVIPLVDQRWAVCRKMGAWCIWRVLDAQEHQQIKYPGWLWTSDDWLDPHQANEDSHPVPVQLPLRTLLQQALVLPSSGRGIIKALAATVRFLRSGSPVAVIVPEEALSNVLHPTRYFAMSVLAMLPPWLRATLRVSIGEVAPRPGEYDLVLTTAAPPAYLAVDLLSPPDEGADIVSYYVRERLLADDPEALEASHFHVPPHPTILDPWTEAVAAILQQAPPGVAVLSDAALGEDPERVVRSLCARMRANVQIHSLVDPLTRVTLATSDHRPWRVVAGRPAEERAMAIHALLKQRDRVRPTPELLATLGATYPSDAPIEPWVTALLGWLHKGRATHAVLHSIQTTLAGPNVTKATRSSVWSEVIYGLVALGEDDAAMDALVSGVAHQIATDGASRALVASCAIVPAAFRDPTRFEQFSRLIAAAPDAESGLIELFRHAAGQPDEASLVCSMWHRHPNTHPEPGDALLDEARRTGQAHLWLSALFANQGIHEAAATLKRVSTGSQDPLWFDAEHALTKHLSLGPAHRFQALAALAPGLDTLEPHAAVWLLDALPRPFPCPEILSVARMLLATHAPSPLWALVTVMSAPVDQWDDATVDSAVVDFCAADHETDVREAAFACAEQLGGAEGFEPLDLARWLVRISLAPDASRITPDLALALVRGILAHPDGLQRLVAVTIALLELPAEHPALLAFVHFLLPKAWDHGPPASYRLAIPIDEVPPPLQLAWSRAYGAEDSC